MKPWLLFLFAANIFASDPATLQKILQNDHRPTMGVIADNFFQISDLEVGISNNPRGSAVFPFVDRLVRNGPKLIAALEFVYPGASWAFIGRDSQLIGDLVEAFYLSMGQKDRVVRIGSSKPTIVKTEDSTIMSYLETKGLNLENLRRPFIFVDTISQGGGRQGRYFLGAVYRTYVSHGGNASDLIRRVNFFGLEVSTTQGQTIDYRSAPNVLKEEEERYRTTPIGDYASEHLLVGFPEPEQLFNESGYDHYTNAWHAPFGTLRDNGQFVIDTPGQSMPIEIKQVILASQIYIHSMVNRESYKTEVQAAANVLGYEFPLSSPIHEIPKPESESFQSEEDSETSIDENETFAGLKKEEAQAVVLEAKQVESNLGNFSLKSVHTQKLLDMESLWEGQKKKNNANQSVHWAKVLHANRTLYSASKNNDLDPFENAEEADGSPTTMTSNGQQLLNYFEQELLRGHNPHVLSLEVFRSLRRGRHGLKLRSVDLKTIALEVFAVTRPSFTLAHEFSAFAKEARAFRDMVKNDQWIQGKPGEKTYLKLKILVAMERESCIEALL